MGRDFPGGSDGKVSVYNVGDQGSIPGLGRSPGEGNGNPLQYYCRIIPWTKEPGSPWGCKESDTTSLSLFTFLGTELHPYLFCLFCLLYFFLPPFEDNGLLFWVPDVLCQHSEVVLWNLLSI